MTRELTRRRGRERMSRPLPTIFPSLRDQLDRVSRMFDEFFGLEEGMTSSIWSPPLDITETEDKVVATTELPGIKPEDLDISISDNVLTIRGEKKEVKQTEGVYAHCCERQFGEFRRSVELPSSVDSDKVNASYQNGVLRIEMQKSPEIKRKKITIKTE